MTCTVKSAGECSPFRPVWSYPTEWSLTDCISFVVMEDAGVQQALTGDQHFEQAGFTALLK